MAPSCCVCVVAAVLVAPRRTGARSCSSWSSFPGDAIDGLRSQLDTRSAPQLAPALLVVGHVLLARRDGSTPTTARARGGRCRRRGRVVRRRPLGRRRARGRRRCFVALEVRRQGSERSTRCSSWPRRLACSRRWFREVAGLGTAAALLALGVLALCGRASARCGSRARGHRGRDARRRAAAGFLRLDPASPPLTPADAELVRARVESSSRRTGSCSRADRPADHLGRGLELLQRRLGAAALHRRLGEQRAAGSAARSSRSACA